MTHTRALALVGAFCLTLVPRAALAHCDTLDGPVVKEARAALDSKDVTPVLKWVRPDKEGEIREAFRHTLDVRALGAEARALADRFFFETLVRVHREGEGAPYTGLKPAGTAVDPAVAASDRALETGSVEPLVKLLTTEVDKGLRHRFTEAAESTPARGRERRRGPPLRGGVCRVRALRRAADAGCLERRLARGAAGTRPLTGGRLWDNDQEDGTLIRLSRGEAARGRLSESSTLSVVFATKPAGPGSWTSPPPTSPFSSCATSPTERTISGKRGSCSRPSPSKASFRAAG